MADLTVIIPSFNMQKGAVAAIYSVLKQDIDTDIILVDDFSIPSIHLPIELLQHPRVNLIRHEKQRGASAARNTGIKNCKSEWIGFLDSDDIFIPNTLGRRLKFVKEVTNTVDKSKFLVCCASVDCYANIANPHIRIPKVASTAKEFASGCWYRPGSCAIAHRTMYEKFPLDEGIKRLEDFDWSIRFGLEEGKLFVDNTVGTLVKMSHRSNISNVVTSSRAIIKKHKKMKKIRPDIWNVLCAYLSYEIGVAAIKEKHFFLSFKHICLSFLRVPRFHKHLSPGWFFMPYNQEGRETMREIK